MNDIIHTDRLTKCFGGVTAVNSISLNVRKGEIYGFLGLNGAGKTAITAVMEKLRICRDKWKSGNFSLTLL
ncbi:MAG: hypothetical protein A2293_09930 [Elusimicrobia bacterium RIFOXYB2_FULL_49_7]|nr:MAG: hypothetical protein A2293_09930 [Elusimicrobia bacterium RIFOXYB2_FULL_49_7]